MSQAMRVHARPPMSPSLSLLPPTGARLPLSSPTVEWKHPSTPSELLRFLVYCDLHDKG